MNPKDTLNKQWKNFVASQCGPIDPLSMYLQIEVTEDTVRAAFSACSELSTFRLKPVVNGLNKVRPGLGWLIYDILADAGRTVPIYNPSEIACFAEHMWFQGSWTDEDVADEIRCMDDSLGGKSLEEIREIYEHPFPSDMIASVDGHAWMLNAYALRGHKWKSISKKPKACSLKDAQAFAGGRSRSPFKALVVAALALREELSRKDGFKLADVCPKAKDLGHSYLDDDSQVMRIGATCFVVWDNPHMTYDAAGHFEEYEMNGGECTDVFYLLSADPTKPGELDRFVSTMQEVIRRYALVSKLLQHFRRE